MTSYKYHDMSDFQEKLDAMAEAIIFIAISQETTQFLFKEVFKKDMPISGEALDDVHDLFILHDSGEYKPPMAESMLVSELMCRLEAPEKFGRLMKANKRLRMGLSGYLKERIGWYELQDHMEELE